MINADYFKALESASKAGTVITSGEWCAYNAWRNTVSKKSSMFEANILPWGSDITRGEMKNFVSTLRAAGVKTFAVTDQSTELMVELHALCAEGCTILGPVNVKRCIVGWDEGTYPGVEIQVNDGGSL